MNRQLLNTNNPNLTYTDANMTQAGIELHNYSAQNSTRAQYVNLDDIADNVVYADKEAERKYQNLQDDYNGLNNDSDEESAAKKNLIQKNQNGNDKHKQDIKQVYNQQGQNPQIYNQQGQSKYPQLKNQQQNAQQIPISQFQQQQQNPTQMLNQPYNNPNSTPSVRQGNQLPHLNNQFPQQMSQYPQQISQYPQPMSQFPQQMSQYPQQMSQFPQQTNQGLNQQGMFLSQSQYGMGQMNQQEFQQQVAQQQKMLDNIQHDRQVKKPVSPNKAQQETIAKAEVQCQYCQIKQKIPMTSKKYQCYNCQNIQDSNPHMPLYSMFMCGKCQSKVLFEPGVSEYIQCTRCATVNKVPVDKNQLLNMFNKNNQQSKNPQSQQQSEKSSSEQQKQESNDQDIKQVKQSFQQMSIDQQKIVSNVSKQSQDESEYIKQLKQQQKEQQQQIEELQKIIQQQKQQQQEQQQSIFSPLVEPNQPPNTSNQPVISLSENNSNSANQSDKQVSHDFQTPKPIQQDSNSFDDAFKSEQEQQGQVQNNNQISNQNNQNNQQQQQQPEQFKFWMTNQNNQNNNNSHQNQQQFNQQQQHNQYQQQQQQQSEERGESFIEEHQIMNEQL